MYTPLNPTFTQQNWGMRRVYLFFEFLLKNIDWVLVRIAEAVLMCTHNLGFEQKQEKYQNFSSENIHFYNKKIFCILHGPVFVMFF